MPTYWAANLKAWLRAGFQFLADDGEDAVGLGLVDALGLGRFGYEFLAE
jgi:hypothetical protein